VKAQRIIWGAILWLLLAVPVSAQEPNQAGLVIQYGEGQVETFCVAFDEDEITGDELLAISGLDLVLDASSAMGVTLCRVEELGCNYPAEHCFCQCMGGGDCSYWNYFYRDVGADTWTYSALGTRLRKIQHGAVEAWVWGDGRIPPSDDLTFETICTTPTPMPTPAVPEASPDPEPTLTPTQPATRVAAATAEPTSTTPSQPSPSPQPLQTVTAPVTVTPALVSADPQDGASWTSYVPFGLMIIALAAVGVLVWRRGS
jgi:hypothetical protein